MNLRDALQELVTKGDFAIVFRILEILRLNDKDRATANRFQQEYIYYTQVPLDFSERLQTFINSVAKPVDSRAYSQNSTGQSEKIHIAFVFFAFAVGAILSPFIFRSTETFQTTPKKPKESKKVERASRWRGIWTITGECNPGSVHNLTFVTKTDSTLEGTYKTHVHTLGGEADGVMTGTVSKDGKYFEGTFTQTRHSISEKGGVRLRLQDSTAFAGKFIKPLLTDSCKWDGEFISR